MTEDIKLMSGNEAVAAGAYHAGVKVATAYPGTPSTEILESIACFEDIYAEWSTNEKVAMEVALGAAYAGTRSLVSMKHVGLNVASDPFMAAATTGINAGMVVISADDPGIHSSQGEQDNRHYAKMAKVPLLEPSDSQEAYDLIQCAFDISEKFDTLVLLRTTTRISHSKSVVRVKRHQAKHSEKHFQYNVEKYVMLPVYARMRRPVMEERLVKLTDFSEKSPLNRIEWGKRQLGVVTSGIAYQYAREVFPSASFLKLGMTFPLPRKLLYDFAAKVERVIVIEELDPFLQDNIQTLGITVSGKEFIPRIGELSPSIIENRSGTIGLLLKSSPHQKMNHSLSLPKRPPLLCPGCPHTATLFTLSHIGQRSRLRKSGKQVSQDPKLIITGDIGCYTLGTYPPLSAMDTCTCMGASIGEALGLEKAGIDKKVVAVIGDSTFLHSGITALIDAIYNEGQITVVILDNRTTAMTGHQNHPGTGVSAQGKKTKAIDLESLVRGLGISDVTVVDAFQVQDIRSALKSSLNSPELSVIIVRGDCSVRVRQRSGYRVVDGDICNQCGICLQLGCPAIQSEKGRIYIESTLCAGDICTICQQICPKGAVMPCVGIQ